MWQALHSLIDQANIGQSRSSVLNPIQWLLVILLAGTCLCLLAHSPLWLMIVLGVGIALALLLFFGAYIYFGKTNSDALRSESYSLTKLAIQNRLLGDSLTGVREVPTTAEAPDALIVSETTGRAQQQ
jgi:hypothetical protein